MSGWCRRRTHNRERGRESERIFWSYVVLWFKPFESCYICYQEANLNGRSREQLSSINKSSLQTMTQRCIDRVFFCKDFNELRSKLFGGCPCLLFLSGFTSITCVEQHTEICEELSSISFKYHTRNSPFRQNTFL
jgi:hypothetical protein